jgi:hypothetical protein
LNILENASLLSVDLTDSPEPIVQLYTQIQSHADCVIQGMRTTTSADHPFAYDVYVLYNTALCDAQNVLKWMTSSHVQYLLTASEPETDNTHIPPLIVRTDVCTADRACMDKLLQGYVFLYVVRHQAFYHFALRANVKRQPSDSNIEVSLRGPRDGFIEDLPVNIALIRKRLPTTQLKCEQHVIGTLTKTKVALLYLEHRITEQVKKDIQHRLGTLECESLLTAQQLENRLQPRSLFSKYQYTGRPDLAAEALLAGKFVLLVDGNPSVSFAPNTLIQQFNVAEDAHFPKYTVDLLGRLLRIFGAIIALLLPGFWTALAGFHQEQLPFALLATVTVTRTGLPFSSTMEIYLILTLFELFREAGVRLPQHIGQTLTVVGGIIIGDASIRAGLISPSLLVIASITAVATFTLGNQDIMAAIGWLRWIILTLAAVLGFFGFFIGLYVAISYFCAQRSFGVYMSSPVSKLGSS